MSTAILSCSVCGGLGHPSYNGRCEDCFVDGLAATPKNYYKDETPKPSDMDQEDVLELPITELELGTRNDTRITNRLGTLGINYIKDLVKWSEQELMKVRGLSGTSLDKIKEGLRIFCLALRQDHVPRQQD